MQNVAKELHRPAMAWKGDRNESIGRNHYDMGHCSCGGVGGVPFEPVVGTSG